MNLYWVNMALCRFCQVRQLINFIFLFLFFFFLAFLTSSMSLEQFYDDIVTKATVDHSSPEIQDITSAVEEILKGLVSGGIEISYKRSSFQTTIKFPVSYLQPCGSMAEKTSLWKSVRRQGRERKFIEFDYLAVLDNQDNVVDIREGGCQRCIEILSKNVNLVAHDFGDAFLSALYSRIHTMCSCIVEPDGTRSKADKHDTRPCDKCTVVRDTGYLQIAKISDFDKCHDSEHCSLVFYWTSYTDSLLAPNVETLQLTERIKRLVIRIDFLPALELSDNRDGNQSGIKRFVIPKFCSSYCARGFMVSRCMHELNAISHGVSEKHRRCYIIIKFLYGQFIYWTEVDRYLESYHAKVKFLQHCETCTNEEEDCTICVTEIFKSLVIAYSSLLHVVQKMKGRVGSDRDSFKQINILCMLHILSQLKSPTETRQCKSQNQPSTAVIKRALRLTLNGKLGIEDNGKFRILSHNYLSLGAFAVSVYPNKEPNSAHLKAS